MSFVSDSARRQRYTRADHTHSLGRSRRRASSALLGVVAFCVVARARALANVVDERLLQPHRSRQLTHTHRHTITHQLGQLCRCIVHTATSTVCERARLLCVKPCYHAQRVSTTKRTELSSGDACFNSTVCQQAITHAQHTHTRACV
jgi:hypothetical protein